MRGLNKYVQVMVLVLAALTVLLFLTPNTKQQRPIKAQPSSLRRHDNDIEEAKLNPSKLDKEIVTTVGGTVPMVTNEILDSRRKRNVFVDLGANCGNSYLYRKDKYRFEDDIWEIYLWEPNPQMMEYFLGDLSKENANIHILPYAAGVKDEELELYLTKGQENITDKKQFLDHGKCDPKSHLNPSGGSSVFQQSNAAGGSISIKSLNFPQWVSQLNLQEGDRFIMKIDIEGAELDILEKMLQDKDDNNLCLTELIEIEFHKQIFEKGTELYRKHRLFEENFPALFFEKCGHEVNLEKIW